MTFIHCCHQVLVESSRYPSNLRSVYKQAYQSRPICPYYDNHQSSQRHVEEPRPGAPPFVGVTSYKLDFMMSSSTKGTSSTPTPPAAPSPSNFMGDGAPNSVFDDWTMYKSRFWNNSKELPPVFARIQSSPTVTTLGNFNDSSFSSDTTHRFEFRRMPTCSRRIGRGTHSSTRVDVAKGAAALDNKTTYDQNFKRWTMVDPHSVSIVRNIDDDNSRDSKFIGETQYKNDFKAHEHVPKVPSHRATSVFQLRTRPSTRQ